ncbi:MAG: AlpA family phage regulatory protein [Deltaproteobacteria bacterium]
MNIVTGAKQKAKHTPHKIQPLSAAENPDALLQVTTVASLIGAGHSTVYSLIKRDPSFPKPIRRGLRCTRFRAGDVTEWLRAQAA